MISKAAGSHSDDTSVEVIVGSHVEAHVQQDHKVFTDAEETVDVRLTVVVVAVVKVHGQANEEKGQFAEGRLVL